jgi:hypothetical protein
MVLAVAAACGGPKAPPPMPKAASAPSLRGAKVLVFPVQNGPVPTGEPNARHFPAERAAIDAEIAYWFKQHANAATWLLPENIDRTIARSPTLNIEARNLAVGSFQRAQVRRIGDPLFGDLARLAAVFSAQVAVIPVAAEYVGADAASAVLNIATAVIDPTDGDVIWFGVIAGTEAGVDSNAAIASAAQAFAGAFAGRPPAGDTKQ